MTKPKCGNGQSCGDTCISAKDTCKAKLSTVDAAKLVAVTRMLPKIKQKALNSFPARDQDLSFDELMTKYPFAKGVGTEEKLGIGLSLWHLEMPASDGSRDKMTYSVIVARSKSYTVSDGVIKEFTASDRNGLYKEAIAAAIRAKVESDIASINSTPTAVVTAPAKTKAKAKTVTTSTAKVSLSPDLDTAQAKIKAQFGTAAVDAAEKNVAKILASDDTQVYIRVGNQNSLLRRLNSGRMLTSAELNVTTHNVPDLKDANYQTARNRVEEKVMGLPLNTPAADRPIYGYLGSESSQLTSGSHGDVQSYGSIAIKLKSTAKDRTTMTGADSFKSGLASKLDDPKAASLMSLTKFGYDIDDPNVTSFQKLMAQGQQSDALFKASSAKNVDDLNKLAPTGSNYIEAQIHGGVKNSDIEEINFTPRSLKDTPSQEVLAKAASLGIKVKIHGVEYDGAKAQSDLADQKARTHGQEMLDIESAIRGTGDMSKFRDGVKALISDSTALIGKPGAQTDRLLYALQDARGFSGKPKVVTESELATELKTGTLVVRGLKGDGFKTASDVAELTRTGDHYIGYGIYGHGMYVGHSGSMFNKGTKEISKSKITGNDAESWVPGIRSKGDIKGAYDGPVNGGYIDDTSADLRMSLPATAKVVTQTQIRKEMLEAATAWDTYASDKANKVTAKDKKAVAEAVFGGSGGNINDDSVSRFAVMAGYDAVALSKSYEPTNFMVVLNHAALVISKDDRDKSKGYY